MVTRRKTAHSTFRRVKRRTTQNAKRNRKQRNNVMRGGGKFEIYVIKNNKNKPICFIVKKSGLGKDDIYLIFDGDVNVSDIIDIISTVAGINLDSLKSLGITTQHGAVLNETYVKLSGIIGYNTVSKGLITTNNNDLLSGKFTKVDGISPTVNDWEGITLNLGKKYQHYMLESKDSPKLSLIDMQNIILKTYNK